jgi:hypothetical protein
MGVGIARRHCVPKLALTEKVSAKSAAEAQARHTHKKI